MANPEKRKFSFDRLDKIQKSLYARAETQPQKVQDGTTPVSKPADTHVSSDWKEDIPEHLGDTVPERHLISPNAMKKILMATGGFFVVSLGVAAFIFFGGGNQISNENVVITVNGPTTVGAGEPLSFDVLVRNDNSVALEAVKLLIDYPDGTRTADAEQKELPRDLDETIGTIATGNSITRTKQAVLFGEADTTQHIIISVEYRVKDSSATYYKEQYYDLLISTAPVRMTINSVDEAVSGNEIELSAEITSNSTTVVSGLMLKVDYPFGFKFSSAAPAPTYNNNVFVLGDLAPADRRVIRIRGSVTGQEGENRLLRFNLGTPDRRDSRLMGTIFLSSSQSIALKRPFVSAVLTLNGSDEEVYSATPGQRISGEISWANNLDSRIADLEIKVKLSGDSLNRASVTAGSGGFYHSVENTVLWDKSTSPAFTVIEPGENGLLAFSFASLPLSSLMYSGITGNEMSIEMTVNARRLSGTNIPDQIVTGVSRKVRISSGIALAARSLYFTGPFPNQGPIPPQADRNTTYTIVWSLTNTLNDASNVQVSGTLPTYISWLENASPGEIVTYDTANRQVLWDVGDLQAGTGFSNSPREVSFQVSLVPSLSQLGNAPVLVSESVVSGVDRYSNAPLKMTAKAVTTKIEDAPANMDDVGKVVE